MELNALKISLALLTIKHRPTKGSCESFPLENSARAPSLVPHPYTRADDGALKQISTVLYCANISSIIDFVEFRVAEATSTPLFTHVNISFVLSAKQSGAPCLIVWRYKAV
jgi:hypothetical protein